MEHAAWPWQWLWQWLWSEWFWLPPGAGWRDLAPSAAGVQKAQMRQLWMALPCGVCVFALRRALERAVIRPVGRRLGLADSAVELRTPRDRALEEAYRSGRRHGGVDYPALSKSLDASEAAVRRWFRRRRRAERSNRLSKFTEACWQVLFYSAGFWYGVWTLWDKDYLWDTMAMWRGWPEHHVTSDLYWYYMIELGFYWTTLCTVFADTQRKDFTEMVLHHVVTICLMVFSWTLNFARIGAIVLVVHDAVDPILNVAKIGTYTRTRWLSDPAFILFLVVWAVTRLGLYPFRVVRSATFELDAECGTCVALKILQVFLLILQLLHVIWTYFILKVALRVVFHGNREDSRSDSEQSDDNSTAAQSTS